jgi:hypothetical protein
MGGCQSAHAGPSSRLVVTGPATASSGTANGMTSTVSALGSAGVVAGSHYARTPWRVKRLR